MAKGETLNNVSLEKKRFLLSPLPVVTKSDSPPPPIWEGLETVAQERCVTTGTA